MAFIAHTENSAEIPRRLSEHLRAVSLLARRFRATAKPKFAEATEWQKIPSPARKCWEVGNHQVTKPPQGATEFVFSASRTVNGSARPAWAGKSSCRTAAVRFARAPQFV